MKREIKTNLASGALTVADAKALRKTLATLRDSEFTGGQLFETGATLEIARHKSATMEMYSVLPDVSVILAEELEKDGGDTPYLLVRRARGDARNAWEQASAGHATPYRLYDAVAEMTRLSQTGYDLGDAKLNLPVDQNHMLSEIEATGIRFNVLEGSPLGVGVVGGQEVVEEPESEDEGENSEEDR